MDPKPKVIAHWDEMGRTRQWSSLYESEIDSRNVHVVTRKIRTLEMLRGETAGTLLDIGCGPGVLVTETLDLGFNYVGMDLAEEMLKEGRVKWGENERVAFRTGDIENIPMADATSQALTCLGVIEYVPDLDAAIKEMHRVLKPGGVAIISNHNKLHIDNVVIGALKPLRWIVLPLVRSVRQARPDSLHRRLLQPSQLDEIMAKAGFTLEEFAFYHFTPLPYPFTVLMPKMAHTVNHHFERFCHTRSMGFWAHGYIGKYQKQ